MSKFHKILGVKSDATDQEIKDAYRSLAKKYHPDVSKDPSSADKFKEISAAYQSIQDGEHNRPEPQRFQSSGFHWQGFDFSPPDFVHEMNRRDIDPDLEIVIDIDFMEACFGSEKNIRYAHMDLCGKCDKNKKEKGEYQKTKCHTCDGRGRRVYINGPMRVDTMCQACHGAGSIVDCSDCGGNFYITKEATLTVKIPAGIEKTLRAQGRGNTNGTHGKYGDLYIHVNVGSHPRFSRNGKDIHSRLEVDYHDCILGSTVKVETIHGMMDVKLPECSNSDTIVIMDRTGIGFEGKQYIKLIVKMPKNIDLKTRKILQNLNKHLKNKNQ